MSEEKKPKVRLRKKNDLKRTFQKSHDRDSSKADNEKTVFKKTSRKKDLKTNDTKPIKKASYPKESKAQRAPKQIKITNQYFASCPRKTETLLAAELKDLGINKSDQYSGGANFQTTPQKALRTILHSRIADRVYKVLFRFKIRSEQDLYEKAFRLPWTDVLDLQSTFKIVTILDSNANRYFKNSLFLSYKLKDAIADSFMKRYDKRPDVSVDNPDVPLRLHLEKAKQRGEFFVTIALDMCGTPMSQRGYRKESNMAPLRENLAAALIKSTDWDITGNEQLCDPMCGSGTILIEAALMRLQVSPSYLKLRNFQKNGDTEWVFLRQKWFLKNKAYQSFFNKEADKINSKNEQRLKNAKKLSIYGSELTQETLKICKMNLRRASVYKAVEIKQMCATQLSLKRNEDGVILTNPPYGERMGEIEKLKNLYHDFGERIKQNFKNTRLYIFTGNPDLRKSISLQTSKRTPFYNGAIECRLLRYDIY